MSSHISCKTTTATTWATSWPAVWRSKRTHPPTHPHKQTSGVTGFLLSFQSADCLKVIQICCTNSQLTHMNWHKCFLCRTWLSISATGKAHEPVYSCMCRLSSLNMTPEETPDLHFLADSRSLKQAITSFGCISAQVMCMQVCWLAGVWAWYLL